MTELLINLSSLLVRHPAIHPSLALKLQDQHGADQVLAFFTGGSAEMGSPHSVYESILQANAKIAERAMQPGEMDRLVSAIQEAKVFYRSVDTCHKKVSAAGVFQLLLNNDVENRLIIFGHNALPDASPRHAHIFHRRSLQTMIPSFHEEAGLLMQLYEQASSNAGCAPAVALGICSKGWNASEQTFQFGSEHCPSAEQLCAEQTIERDWLPLAARLLDQLVESGDIESGDSLTVARIINPSADKPAQIVYRIGDANSWETQPISPDQQDEENGSTRITGYNLATSTMPCSACASITNPRFVGIETPWRQRNGTNGPDSGDILSLAIMEDRGLIPFTLPPG